MVKKSILWPVFIYGVLIICLGYYGYHLTGSEVSLWSGVGLGGLLMLSTLIMLAGKVEGVYTALILTALLTGVFAFRYTVTSRPIPAILSVASGGMLLYLLARLANWKK